MHIIRLRQPWQAAWRDHTVRKFRAVQYSRHFHRPSGLRDQQPVTLILQPTGEVSLALQPHEVQPHEVPPDHTAPATAQAWEPAATVAIHSISLNSQLLSLSAATNDTQHITHLCVRIESKLAPFNQLEIVCSFAGAVMAGAVMSDAETTGPGSAPPTAQADSAPPPVLSQWAEVRLEIND